MAYEFKADPVALAAAVAAPDFLEQYDTLLADARQCVVESGGPWLDTLYEALDVLNHDLATHPPAQVTPDMDGE